LQEKNFKKGTRHAGEKEVQHSAQTRYAVEKVATNII
jgi:hypothetical protein